MDIDTLRAILEYDAEHGWLLWKLRPIEMFSESKRPRNHCAIFNARFAGARALTCVTGDGYHSGTIMGRPYLAHRVAWALHHGYWPIEQIDHVNGIRDDNRIVNLREATSAQNAANRKIAAVNTSGAKGVSLIKKTRKWRVQIEKNGEKHHIGTFETFVEARAAYAGASKVLHGAFGKTA